MTLEEVLRSLGGGESIKVEIDTVDSKEGVLTLSRTPNRKIYGDYHGSEEYFYQNAGYPPLYLSKKLKTSVTLAEFLAQCGGLVKYDWIEYKYRYELKQENKKLNAALQFAVKDLIAVSSNGSLGYKAPPSGPIQFPADEEVEAACKFYLSRGAAAVKEKRAAEKKQEADKVVAELP